MEELPTDESMGADADERFPVRQAARETGLSEKAVRNLIRRGASRLPDP